MKEGSRITAINAMTAIDVHGRGRQQLAVCPPHSQPTQRGDQQAKRQDEPDRCDPEVVDNQEDKQPGYAGQHAGDERFEVQGIDFVVIVDQITIIERPMPLRLKGNCSQLSP